jgi:hypothetical protein
MQQVATSSEKRGLELQAKQYINIIALTTTIRQHWNTEPVESLLVLIQVLNLF